MKIDYSSFSTSGPIGMDNRELKTYEDFERNKLLTECRIETLKTSINFLHSVLDKIDEKDFE